MELIDLDQARRDSIRRFVCWPIGGDINSPDDHEISPIARGSDTIIFTRSGPHTILNTEDIYVASRTNGEWTSERLKANYNGGHSASIVDMISDKQALLFLCDDGKFARIVSSFGPSKPAATPNHFNGPPTNSLYNYSYDPFLDFPETQGPGSEFFPVGENIIEQQHFQRRIQLEQYSGITLSSGSLYLVEDIDKFLGFNKLPMPLSTVYWESDLHYVPAFDAYFLTSDRHLAGNETQEKKQITGPSEYWMYGDTDIYMIESQWMGIDSQFVYDYPINTRLSERCPVLTANADTLFFSSNGLPGYGGFDVYYVVRMGADLRYWSDPVNLGPDINTEHNELWFRPLNNNTYVFCRDATGNFDVHLARRVNTFVESFLDTTSTCFGSISVAATGGDEGVQPRSITVSVKRGYEVEAWGEFQGSRTFNYGCIQTDALGTVSSAIIDCESTQPTFGASSASFRVRIHPCEEPTSAKDFIAYTVSATPTGSTIKAQVHPRHAERFTESVAILTNTGAEISYVERPGEALVISIR